MFLCGDESVRCFTLTYKILIYLCAFFGTLICGSKTILTKLRVLIIFHTWWTIFRGFIAWISGYVSGLKVQLCCVVHDRFDETSNRMLRVKITELEEEWERN
jgi:hypothetical protein